MCFFFFSSRRRHTRWPRDWSSDVCSSDLCSPPDDRCSKGESDMNRLQGKTALITGAARGIGAQIARRFTEEGAKVIINDLSLEAARATAEALGGHALAADVSDSGAVAAMFAEVEKLTPRLDILVNNAGISGVEGRTDLGDIVSLRLKQADEAARGGP